MNFVVGTVIKINAPEWEDDGGPVTVVVVGPNSFLFSDDNGCEVKTRRAETRRLINIVSGGHATITIFDGGRKECFKDSE